MKTLCFLESSIIANLSKDSLKIILLRFSVCCDATRGHLLLLILRLVLLAEKQCLGLLINVHLVVDCLDAFLNCFVARVLEVTRRFVEAIDDGFDGLRVQIRSPLQVKKVQADDLVKVLLQKRIIVEVNAIIELGELQNDIYHLWLVCARQTIMLLPLENAFRAFVDHLGAN